MTKRKRCPDVDCVLDAGHSTVCRFGDGSPIPQGARYHTPQAQTFRSSPGREIRGSIATEFEHGDELLRIVEQAEILEPYLTYYLWNEKLHELRRSPNPAHFFTVCLANHGLEVHL